MKRCSMLFLFTLMTSACSSKFVVSSEPVDAIVSIRAKKGESAKTLGKTPLQISASELEEKLGPEAADISFIDLEIAKEGYHSQSYSIPSPKTGTLLTEISVELKKKDKDAEEEKSKEELSRAEDLINQLFLAQRFALTSQFERALMQLDKVIEKYPNFARALSMKGSIYMAQKDYKESLKWYESAIEVDPQMEQTVKLAAKVREILAGRRPAGRK